MVKRAVHAMVVAWLALLLAACSGQPAPQGAGPAASANPVPGASPATGAALASSQGGELRVFAAASLTDAFTEIGHTFESQNPGSSVVFNFGPSSGLRTQIVNGAYADVFASADQANMDQAKSAGVIAGDPQVFAQNVLVIVVPADNPGGVQTPADLAKPGLRVVTTNQAVPIGAYTRQMLDKMSRDPTYGANFSQRVQANVRSEEEDVRSLLAKITLGEADAGVVYTSDVTPQIAPQVKVLNVPDQYNVIASYPIAVVDGSHQTDMANRFIQFVLSDAGQTTIAKWGLRRAH